MLLTDMGIPQAGITALLGYAVVFFGLILLMLVTLILGKVFSVTTRKEVPQFQPEAPKPAVREPVAPGSAGGVKLYNVEPKTAAMLMAIVADKLGKPVNELRFLSIKEVDQV